MRGLVLRTKRLPDIVGRGTGYALMMLLAAAIFAACAPRRAYRYPLPPPASPPRSTPLPLPQPSEPRPALEQSKVREEELRERGFTPQAITRDQLARRSPSREMVPLPAEEGSLLSKITAQTPPQKAASLRLTEEGRKLIEGGEYGKALARLEKTIALDSTNGYGYFYLGRAHHYLGRYQESLNFLDVAESLLAGQAYWLAEVFALKGENFRALGFQQRADSSYSEALRLNPGNRIASERLGLVQGDAPPTAR